MRKRSVLNYFTLSYSWRFSRYSAPIHWLVHCHMTSNNETVSRQMPWAGNIAKTMTSNRKQFTVTREMSTAVARHLSICDYLFSTGLTHLLCYITKHLMTFVSGNIEIRGKQNSLFPKGPVIKCSVFGVTLSSLFRLFFSAQYFDDPWIPLWSLYTSWQTFNCNNKEIVLLQIMSKFSDFALSQTNITDVKI